jgi:FMN-dependent NADH-azoreductase
MKTLLRIDASAQRTGSHSRSLADYYQAGWMKANPEGKVIGRDLAAVPPPHLDADTVAVLYAGGNPDEGQKPAGITLSDELIGELEAANDVVVSSALYNFNIPSSLKAWIDHIVRFGRTISSGEKGTVGLLGGRSVCILTARGGSPAVSSDYQGPSLQAVFRYVGFTRIDWISLEGTKIPDGALDARIAKARAAVDALFPAKMSV